MSGELSPFVEDAALTLWRQSASSSLSDLLIKPLIIKDYFFGHENIKSFFINMLLPKARQAARI